VEQELCIPDPDPAFRIIPGSKNENARRIDELNYFLLVSKKLDLIPDPNPKNFPD
jgi:hypothetical protein